MNNDFEKKLTKSRNSNLELFRIITMLLIIAHHYVVNSGLTDSMGPLSLYPDSIKTIIYNIIGAWGKVGINCFVLITGYFMCKSKITLHKFLKLLLELWFYGIVITSVFFITGYETFSVKHFGNIILQTCFPFFKIKREFIGTFYFFYLCIPFLNIMIQNFNKRQHLYLCIVLFFIYVVIGSLDFSQFFDLDFNYLSWFCVLYIFASYLRYYPVVFLENTKITLCLTLLSFILGMLSVIFYGYRFLVDSNKILAVSTSIFAFMLFKNLKIKYNPIINTIGSTTFGVLLIHANSSVMRKWLWIDVLNNISMYYSKYWAMHIICCVMTIFLICSVLDLFRIKFIEKYYLLIAEKIIQTVKNTVIK